MRRFLLPLLLLSLLLAACATRQDVPPVEGGGLVHKRLRSKPITVRVLEVREEEQIAAQVELGELLRRALGGAGGEEELSHLLLQGHGVRQGLHGRLPGVRERRGLRFRLRRGDGLRLGRGREGLHRGNVLPGGAGGQEEGQQEQGQKITAEAFMDKTASFQDAAAIPLFIGVDEEGGTVARASRNPNLFEKKFRSPREVYLEFEGGDGIRADAIEKSTGLLSYGINVNFAPVADVSTDPADFIYARTYGLDAEQTAFFVGQTVEEMTRLKTGSVLKHFPGYGSNADTHTGIAVDERPYEQFQAEDFLPFRAGIQAGAGAGVQQPQVIFPPQHPAEGGVDGLHIQGTVLQGAHQPNRAVVPPFPAPPSAIPANMPVIGRIKQLMKKTPCTIIRYFSHLSALELGLMERPMKNVERAIIP